MGTADQQPSAVLDVGSNTIRLLVARISDGQIDKILDRSEFVRLGLGVDTTGELRPDREDAAIEAIKSLAGQARQAGAREILAIATSAVRDATNGERFVQRVRDSTGVPLEIISGEREADLTFQGASLGLDIRGGALVCDLGGGSTELIYANENGIEWATSEKIGSGRLTERFVRHDPPEQAELSAVSSYVADVLGRLPPATVEQVAFTGGTATHAALMAGVTGTVERLGVETLAQVGLIASSRLAAEIASQYRFQLERARVLPAGIATLLAITRHYGVDRLAITRNGIREGALTDLFRRKGRDG